MSALNTGLKGYKCVTSLTFFVIKDISGLDTELQERIYGCDSQVETGI